MGALPPLVAIDADVLGRQRTGDESYVTNLLHELPAIAPDLRFAAITRHPELVPAGIEPVQLPARNQVYRMSVTLPRLLRRLRPALAHFQYAVPLMYGGRSLITVHDLSFEADRSFTSARDRFVFKRSVRRSVRRAQAVVTVSEFTRSELIRHYRLDPARVYAHPNGLDPSIMAAAADPERPQSKRKRPFALYVGTLHPRKDPVTAVEALALMPEPLDLIMIGPDKGSEAAVRAAIRRLDVSDRVQLQGHVRPGELATLYGDAECLVFPSLYEGFGLPLLEAMAFGTPVVAANTSSIPEVAGDAAILVEPSRPSALAGGMKRAMADRERLARLGRERAANYSWRTTAEQLADLYRKLVA